MKKEEKNVFEEIPKCQESEQVILVTEGANSEKVISTKLATLTTTATKSSAHS